jgi:hypothetical protein
MVMVMFTLVTRRFVPVVACRPSILLRDQFFEPLILHLQLIDPFLELGVPFLHICHPMLQGLFLLPLFLPEARTCSGVSSPSLLLGSQFSGFIRARREDIGA